MKTNELLKKSFEYNKAGFEHLYSSVAALQEQAEAITGKTLEGAGFIPEEGKAFVRKCIEGSKEARERTRQAVTKGQEQFEQFIAAI